MQTVLAPAPFAAVLADTTPVPENTTPAAGAMELASRADHVHARLTSVGAETSQLLDASGEASITFTRTFAKNPSVIISEVEATDLPSVTFKVKSYTLGSGATAGLVIGCVIKGKRRQALPNNLVLLTVLNGFLPEVNASGARFSYIAVASSQP